MAGSGTAHLRNGDDALLLAEHLVVEFPVGHTGLKVHAVSDVSLDVHRGETLGLVGESGCGKTTTGRALMQLPRPTAGTVRYDGTELTTLGGADLRRVRPEMQMIFQDPISSLNPRRKVGDIVAEPLRIWASETNPPGARLRTARLLLLADAALRGGALALLLLFLLVNSGIPGLTGLQYRVLGGVDDWLRASNVSLFLSALVLGTASFALAPLVGDRAPRSRWLLALEAVAATGLAGLALGGSSWAYTVVALVGAALVVGALVLVALSGPDFAAMGEVRAGHDRTVRRVLEDVGIDPDDALGRRPHQFSGGQCQRICIARALVLDPQIIICDEPVSALDVSVQAQILNLLEDMKARYGLTLVFIAHDLAVVKNVSDRVAVMYLGKLCEVAAPDTLYHAPAHPYTAALLDSIPVPDPTLRPRDRGAVSGEIPSPVSPPSGCRFRTRCPRAAEVCAEHEPVIRPVATGHHVACHFPLVGAASTAAGGNGQGAEVPPEHLQHR
jgi:oligopeptide/dipeptide ABC transporter ATP-binding protein